MPGSIGIGLGAGEGICGGTGVDEGIGVDNGAPVCRTEVNCEALGLNGKAVGAKFVAKGLLVSFVGIFGCKGRVPMAAGGLLTLEGTLGAVAIAGDETTSGGLISGADEGSKAGLCNNGTI